MTLAILEELNKKGFVDEAIDPTLDLFDRELQNDSLPSDQVVNHHHTTTEALEPALENARYQWVLGVIMVFDVTGISHMTIFGIACQLVLKNLG